ncbi:MAG: hypothetical protein M3P70_01400 [Actinomycetota bacterium]|nr:hypothetical protein [Actinomycetota bacterium]
MERADRSSSGQGRAQSATRMLADSRARGATCRLIALEDQYATNREDRRHRTPRAEGDE